MLGKGAYGEVKLVRASDRQFALKESSFHYPEDLEVVIASLREEAMSLQHPFLIQVYWRRWLPGKFQQCMELGQKVEVADAARIFHDIGNALWWMHKHGLMHRDVKPENILQVDNRYKLCDFGLTRRTGTGQTMTGYMVSRWFRPPELLLGKVDTYDGRVDMWSLGVTAWHFDKGGGNGKYYLFDGDKARILNMYKHYKPMGLYKYVVCDYDKRLTSKQLLDECGVTPVEGYDPLKTPQREGKVATFVDCLLRGDNEAAVEMSKGINMYDKL
jgi:serine/threonine protein kinase